MTPLRLFHSDPNFPQFSSLAVEALQERAAPGRLLCSEATARLVRRDVRLEEVAPVPVPGQPSPLRTYQIVGLRSQDVSGAQVELRARSPFVGRAHELATLHAVLAQVVGGRGQSVGIVGEPGIGKSRLLVEWHQQLHAHGVAYLEGHCLSYGSATPYLPVLDLLRAHCGITPADGDDAITTKVYGSLQALGLAPDTAALSLLHLLGVEAATVQVAGSSPETLKAHTFATLRNHSFFVAGLSEVCRLAGRGDEAWQHAHQALNLAQQQKERGNEARALHQLGAVHAHADPPDAEQAEAHYQQALALAEALGMRPLQAHCHHGLGTLYATTGQQEQARTALSTAIEMYRAMEMTFWLPQADATLAQVV